MTCGGVMTPTATTANSAPTKPTTTESCSQIANSLSADQSTNVREDGTGLNGNDLEKATTCHHQTHTFQQLRLDLRKSHSMGKVNVKKGIATRLGRFRQRRESRGGIGGGRGAITNGESDSEAFTDDARNRVEEGLTQKLSMSLPSSNKARVATTPFLMDSTPPPRPPLLIRAHTCQNQECHIGLPPATATGELATGEPGSGGSKETPSTSTEYASRR
ncbi:MAG: hypothetical protein J3Q66DRAFT_193169 [Benniella sp.]|nr:MAG: hypothetical protein J3Q66DRAFT_193169 [Benniella sp.]